MGFNDIKHFGNRIYSGMRVGDSHLWDYTNAVWQETKIDPNLWQFSFTSVKRRHVAAPERSGVPLDTKYHWFILADQRVQKTTANSYQTAMTGLKYKVGHQRPYWKNMSYTYPGQLTYRQRLIQILKDTLQRLEACQDIELPIRPL